MQTLPKNSNMYHFLVLILNFITPQAQLTDFRRVSFGYSPNFSYPYTSQVKVVATTNFNKNVIIYNCTGSAITDLIVLTNAHYTNTNSNSIY